MVARPRAPVFFRPPFLIPLAAAIVVICAAEAARAQTTDRVSPGVPYVDTLAAASDTLVLSRQFVDRSSLVLLRGDGTRLRDSVEYTLDARNGIVVLRARAPSAAGQPPPRLVARYRALPYRFEPVYRLRSLVMRRDSVRGDTVRIAAPSEPLNIESIFGSSLQKSGYIGRGFTVGTNRDLSINSGFRLQLSGNLADDITLAAALTDENTPIQPEGNTRTLQELDNVFIRIASPHLAATLGDFMLAYGGTEFGRYTRKLSGVLAEGTAESGTASVSYASMKGTFRSMQFAGIDGVQGPYRLTGKNGEPRIVILAGTERVYVDGVRMVRGENDDYVIEYASGEVTFRPRRLITSYSRITIDFEYADRQFVRSLITAGGTAALFGDRMQVTARVMREGDNQDSPIDQQLSDSDRAVLARAGRSQQLASTPGAAYVGHDTARGTGAGQYALIDTVVAGQAARFFRYAPGSDSATYTVSFSYVGTGQGEYTRRAIGYYEYAGPGGGDYAPLRLLPMPELHQLGDILVTATPVQGARIGGELGLSGYSRNRFSTDGSAVDNGAAYNLTGSWTGAIGAIGTVDASAHFRSVSTAFAPIDRIDDIEFNRKWDIGTSTAAEEIIREGTIGYRPAHGIRLYGGAGSISRGMFSSLRAEGGVSLNPDSGAANGVYATWSFEDIRSSDGASRTDGSWFRQRGEAEYRMRVFTPRISIEQEHRETTAADTLTQNTLAFIDIRPGVRVAEFARMTLTADAGMRTESAWLRGALVPQANDLSGQLGWALRSWHDLTASAAVTVRNRRFTDAFRLAGNTNLSTLLMKAQAQYTPLQRAVAADAMYDISTEKTSKLERLFMKVPLGQGNYIYKGDLNNNGIADENEFEPTRFDGEYVLVTVPTDQLFPVVDLRTSARLQLTPSRLMPAPETVLARLLAALSTETVVRIEEKSSDPRTSNISLLRLSTFLNDSTTIRGFQNVRQDLFLFGQSSDFSLRFRFDQGRGFSQYALASERSFRRERSVRMRAQPVREIGVQADLAFTNDDVSSTEQSNRARAITGTTFSSDFSYRPWQRVEIGFVIGGKSASDAYAAEPVDASMNSQTVRTSVSFDGPGRLRIELERDEVTLSRPVDAYPFELTDGRPDGKSWVIRGNFDYRFTSFLQATFTYLGRAERSGSLLHTARAEVKAFF